MRLNEVEGQWCIFSAVSEYDVLWFKRRNAAYPDVHDPPNQLATAFVSQIELRPPCEQQLLAVGVRLNQ